MAADDWSQPPNQADGALVVSCYTGEKYSGTNANVAALVTQANADDKLALLAAIQAAVEEQQNSEG